MPNKTVYIKDEDLVFLEKAQEISQESISAVVTEALKRFVSEEEKRRIQENRHEQVEEQLKNILQTAIELRASDIHFQPGREEGVIRARIDGSLRILENIPRSIYHHVVDHLLSMTDLFSQENGYSQGRISTNICNQALDLRVISVSSLLGTTLTIRVLYKEEMKFDLQKLEPSQKHSEIFRQIAKQPFGLVIITGPTGTGKTTTLYSLLESIDRVKNKVMTVENPVEAILDNTVPIAIDSQKNLSFAPAIRGALMSDLDVIAVGEIRDLETARLCVEIAITGHLVFTILHTHSAASAITRLIDIGIESFLVRDAVVSVIGQRLVRKLCTCRKKSKDTNKSLPKKWQKVSFYEPIGCEKCGNSGYKGVTPIFEILQNNPELHQTITDHSRTETLEETLLSLGMKSMLEDGLEKAAAGETSVSEVLRVLHR